MRQLIRGRIIKHHSFKDVAVDVLAVYILPGKVKIKGQWINMGFTESYPIEQKCNLIIPDLRDWLFLRDRNIKCYRNGPWVPIVDSSDDVSHSPRPRLSR